MQTVGGWCLEGNESWTDFTPASRYAHPGEPVEVFARPTLAAAAGVLPSDSA